MRALLVLAILLIIACCSLVAASRQQKDVNVELRAKWSGTPLLLEISELLSQERPALFWKMTERWLDADVSLETGQHLCYEKIVSHATALLGSDALASVLQLSLIARIASPKLVLFRQLARDSLLAHSVLSADTTGSDRWSISENPPAPRGKCCWVDVGYKLLLEEDELLRWVEDEQGLEDQAIDVHDFDHVYAFSGSPKRVAVMYGGLGTACFKRFHGILRNAAQHGGLKYVLRPVLPAGCESACACGRLGTGRTMKLAGYGVELALKNMEYKAIDDSEVDAVQGVKDSRSEDMSQDVRGFIFSKLMERKPHLAGELMTFRDHLLSSDISDSMNVWELKDLGYQVAERIVGASEPLRLMQELSQNFPKLVSSLSRMKLNETIKEEIVSNQQMVAPGRNLVAINGALLNPESLDLFSLVRLVREEVSFADMMVKIKVPNDVIRKLMQLPDGAEQSRVRLDFRSDDFVHYLNDLEQDPKYRRWRANLNELLMPVFPGQLRYIRKNLYHAVYAIDPGSLEELKLVRTITHYYHNNLPVRFGVILLSPHRITRGENGAKDLSSLVIRLFLYVKEHHGVQRAFQFLNNIVDAHEDEDEVMDRHVEEAFLDFLKEGTDSEPLAIFSEVITNDRYEKAAAETSLFAERLGLSRLHPVLLMNGLVYAGDQAQSALTMAMNEELQRLQEGVYYGHINGRTDILEFYLADEGYKRYNPKILATGKDGLKYVPLAVPIAENHPVVARLHYLHFPGTEDAVKPVTHWVVVDLTQLSGVHLLKETTRYLVEGSEGARVGVLYNMGNEPLPEADLLLVKIVEYVTRSSSAREEHLKFLHKFLQNYGSSKLSYQETLKLLAEAARDAGLNSDTVKTSVMGTSSELVSWLEQDRAFLSEYLSLDPCSNALLTNGRVIIQEEAEYTAEDLSLLEAVEYRWRLKDIQELIEGISWDEMDPDEITSEFLSSRLMVISSMMAFRSRSSESANFQLLKTDHSAIVRNSDSFLHIDAVINPLSSVGQKLTPLLLLLEEWVRPSLNIILNPMNSLADVPLKNFYRYVLPSQDDLLIDGLGPSARFTNMPPSRTLTMNLDVPEAWLVEPVVAIHDLDNILLEKLGNERTLHAVYELDAMMITGHCYERGEPPRGLQIILGTERQPHMVDTIVMANLGYFQLKAGPGAWTLKLADGRSSELYTLSEPKQGTSHGPLSRRILVSDLRGELVHLDVVKRRGMENEKLLEPGSKKKQQKKGIFEWLLGGGTHLAKTNSSRQGEPVNIFSIASGHLYERFLKIMVLSVLKNTNRPVKFWFIKNYLSPQFKDFIPLMAARYGFEYELVTYKWPTWLHKQTEKQRIIWAYKILFLDVIFPLSLKKVIFVDADQIVRTDMGELYDMNINGKPLAYTPFCDNNKDMDGYRFWRQGFWKEHLQGRPYHISALYVVDLDVFRQTAAGDNLRVFYESLSKDPNSLSNLDQDLPNYAQHTVPIFSLPQEWLWCESWCGNATKSKAKTIDLCNNPMTKEPKLQGAKRIVAEWPALDEEAREITKEILGKEVDDAGSVQSQLGDEEQPSSSTSSENEDVKDEL